MTKYHPPVPPSPPMPKASATSDVDLADTPATKPRQPCDTCGRETYCNAYIRGEGELCCQRCAQLYDARTLTRAEYVKAWG